MTKFNTLLSSLASAWLILGLASPGLAQSPCVNGSANYNGTNYPCSNVDLLSIMGVNQVGGGEMNDIWGWTDPLDGNEYVILGRTDGTAFIDISDPVNPVYLGNLNTNTVSSLWRDIKVYNNHAFIVSEAGNHGMQIFDLTKLRNVPNPPENFSADEVYEGFNNAHNIVINEESGRAYAVGTNTASGGLHIMDISNPLNPTLLGFFSEDGYTHDAQVVNYIGPDGQYSGKEIAFACNENTVTIVDVTDPTDATIIAAEGYSNSAYTHQGWLTEDHKYFVVGDELDEQFGNVEGTTTYFWNIEDLDNPILVDTYTSPLAAIDHNLYIKDGIAYQSNYRAGLRMLDLNNITNATEIGFFDLYPSSNSAQFNGTWSNYPFFASGVVAVSHIEDGLFLVQPNFPEPCTELCGCTDVTACNYDASAVNDDDSCDFSCYGCTNNAACNYDASATLDDGSCILDGGQVVVTILTDNYPAETTWTVTNDEGATVMSGGPYSDVGTIYTETNELTEGCYTLTVNDSFGDGICCAYGTGSFTVTVCGTDVVMGGEFGSTVSEEFCVEPSEVPGCTEVFACNFDPEATVDDGSCIYPFDIVYEDADGDGIGGDLAIADVCELGPGISLETGDCDDSDDSVYPGAPGTAEGIDNNCDGVVSGDELTPCPADVNSDGQITVADVLLILSDFGCMMDCQGDVNGDDSVNVADVLASLAAFGQPC